MNIYMMELDSLSINDSCMQIKPVWSDVETALCVSSSNEYSKYLSVYLKSVVSHSLDRIDIVVFETEISDENKRLLLDSISSERVSIRFINPSFLFDNIDLYVSHDYFRKECYFRIAAPKVLSAYKKIIFTDLDLIVLDNILKLKDLDMGGCPIAACIEPLWREFYMQNNRINGYLIRDYTINVLKLRNPFMYFNTGVLVIDVNRYNELASFEKMLNIIASNKLLYQEQCAINMFFIDKIFPLSPIWNFELAPLLITNKFNFDFYNEYKVNFADAKVLHYLGRYKPWTKIDGTKNEIWWNFARQTPFYEEIFFSLLLKSNILHDSVNKIDHKPNPVSQVLPSLPKDIDFKISLLRNELANIHFRNINSQFEKLDEKITISFVMSNLWGVRFLKFKFWLKMHFKKHGRQKYEKKYLHIVGLLSKTKNEYRSLLKI